jgi:flagellar biosynthetic protein FliQ
MNEQVAITIFAQALQTAMIVSAPVLLVGLVVGTVIAILQSLTQIQETTITFVPKLIASFIVMVFFAPWMLQVLATYTTELIQNIPQYAIAR